MEGIHFVHVDYYIAGGRAIQTEEQLDKFWRKFVQFPFQHPGKPLPLLYKIIASRLDSFYYQDNNNLTSLLSPRYYPMKVEPIRNVKDIRAIKRLLANSPRNYALFVIGINTNLRASDILILTVGQARNLKLGDEVVLKDVLILGCFMETLSMMITTVPIITPIIVNLGYDPIWFGVLLMVLLETALITPPIGVNLYVIQGVRKGGEINDVIIGTSPFVLAMFIMLMLLIVFPQIAMWAPLYLNQ